MFWFVEALCFGLFILGLIYKNPVLLIVGAAGAIAAPLVLMPAVPSVPPLPGSR